MFNLMDKKIIAILCKLFLLNWPYVYIFSNQYVVTDYSMRNAIHVELLENQEKIAKHLPLGVPGGCKNLFLLVMLENYDKKMVECVFSCNSL